MDPRKNNRIWQNNNYALHRLQQSLRLHGSQSTVEHIKEHGSARTPYKKPVCESRSCSKNGIWWHRVVWSEKRSLCLVDRASFVNTLLLFQLDTLFYFPDIFAIFFLQFSLHVSDRLVHHQENQIARAASGPFPSFVAISCVAVGAN